MQIRPMRDDDREFSFRVYASSRERELAPLDWDESDKAVFLRSQFELQDAHYRSHFPKADFQIIESNGKPIGRLYVDRGPELIRILDIALLSEARGNGIGTALLQELLAEARSLSRPVEIHVEPFNPSKQLMERLGFRTVEQTAVTYRMNWQPDDTDD